MLVVIIIIYIIIVHYMLTGWLTHWDGGGGRTGGLGWGVWAGMPGVAAS